MSEPFPDVIQDLWQLSHVTASYVGRAAAGRILLATRIIDDNAIAIVVAAPFLYTNSEMVRQQRLLQTRSAIKSS